MSIENYKIRYIFAPTIINGVVLDLFALALQRYNQRAIITTL
jgi:hypothetical protein